MDVAWRTSGIYMMSLPLHEAKVLLMTVDTCHIPCAYFFPLGTNGRQTANNAKATVLPYIR